MATIDLNRIGVFVRVVESGSFSGAARLLEIPGSSVSRAVAKLERELGVRLLQRTTRKLRLTDAGRQFYRRMQAVLSEAEAATRALRSGDAATRGIVRISAPVGFASPQFSSIIAALLRRHPELVIDLSLTNRVVDLVADGIDLAIRGGVLPDSSLVARRIAGGDLGVFAAPSYVERRGSPRRPNDLSRHDCLTYRGRNGKLHWRLLGPSGDTTVAVSGPIVCDDMSFLLEAACAGLGLALLPIHLAESATRTGALVRVLPRFRFAASGLYLVWPSQQLVPARVIAAREFLIAELSELFN
jgi:DNA-binding transcriptional LysR family regulator